jgi:hypothetical protein
MWLRAGAREAIFGVPKADLTLIGEVAFLVLRS